MIEDITTLEATEELATELSAEWNKDDNYNTDKLRQNQEKNSKLVVVSLFSSWLAFLCAATFCAFRSEQQMSAKKRIRNSEVKSAEQRIRDPVLKPLHFGQKQR